MTNSNTDWTLSFFNGLALDVLRRLAAPEQTRAEADYVVAQLALPAGAHLLDIPCGDGRLSRALAQRGYRVTGVDIAPDLIATAAIEATASVSYQVGDMRKLPTDGPFDGAFCFGNSFAYFDDTGNLAFLREVARVLRPGGRFVLQTNVTAESILARALTPTWYVFDEVTLLTRGTYDARHGTHRSDYRFLAPDRVEEKSATYRIYTAWQIVEYAERAGFKCEALHGGLDGAVLTAGAPTALFHFQKR